MHVAGQHQDYLCEIFEHHTGPCANQSVPHSVQRRDTWEAENPGWETLSAFDDPFKEIKP